MPTYKVVETCKASVRTTYTVEAESEEEAEAIVKAGEAGEAIEEEVYDYQYPEYEIEETPRVADAPPA